MGMKCNAMTVVIILLIAGCPYGEIIIVCEVFEILDNILIIVIISHR